MRKDGYTHPLARDGIIRRTKLPTWMKRGVFYRDRGRCINCGKDLTGAIVTGEEVHYDHIIPLAEGGTNDPTNFQLLCRGCNLGKARGIMTSDRYPVYWRLRVRRNSAQRVAHQADPLRSVASLPCSRAAYAQLVGRQIVTSH